MQILTRVTRVDVHGRTADVVVVRHIGWLVGNAPLTLGSILHL